MSKKTEPQTLPAVVEEEISTVIIVPSTGEIVDLGDEKQCAKALSELQILKAKIASAELYLRKALDSYTRTLGARTFHVPGVGKVEVKGGSETTYDAEALESRLRALGMPEARIRQIVVETIEYRVSPVEAKRAASANEEYAKALKSVTSVREKTPTVNFA